MFPGTLFLVMLASIIANSFVQFLEWFLVLRTEDYKEKMEKIETANQKIEDLKQKLIPKISDKEDTASIKKKQQKLEENLKEQKEFVKKLNTELSVSRLKSTVATAVVMIFSFGYLSSWFGGIVVGKIPFTPFGLVQGITHRGLSGEDYTDCSFLFVYVLTSMAMRSNLQKWLGIKQPANGGMPSLFDTSSWQEELSKNK